jgi:hypothetical protein
MGNPVKAVFLDELAKRFGPPRRLSSASQSLFEVGERRVRIYIRYSKRHANGTFFGLRTIDLQLLKGHTSFLCFLWNMQPEPLLVRYEDFEEIFAALTPASDNQFKAQVFERDEEIELYIANAGRFKVESYLGWTSLETAIRF